MKRRIKQNWETSIAFANDFTISLALETRWLFWLIAVDIFKSFHELGQVPSARPETGCLTQHPTKHKISTGSRRQSFRSECVDSDSPFLKLLINYPFDGVRRQWNFLKPTHQCVRIFSEKKLRLSINLMLQCVSASVCWDFEWNFLPHQSQVRNIVFISLHTNFFSFFSFSYIFLYHRNKKKVVVARCCFSFLLALLLFFFPNWHFGTFTKSQQV